MFEEQQILWKVLETQRKALEVLERIEANGARVLEVLKKIERQIPADL